MSDRRSSSDDENEKWGMFKRIGSLLGSRVRKSRMNKKERRVYDEAYKKEYEEQVDGNLKELAKKDARRKVKQKYS